jgi:hypothetical protein
MSKPECEAPPLATTGRGLYDVLGDEGGGGRLCLKDPSRERWVRASL